MQDVDGRLVAAGQVDGSAFGREHLRSFQAHAGIATQDEDGFITIRDRLSRFSKIGGEMVPHVALEELCASAAGSSETAVAVTSLPHPTKGEELVVLYVPEHADPDAMHEAVTNSDLPNLCKPRRDKRLNRGSARRLAPVLM